MISFVQLFILSMTFMHFGFASSINKHLPTSLQEEKIKSAPERLFNLLQIGEYEYAQKYLTETKFEEGEYFLMAINEGVLDHLCRMQNLLTAQNIMQMLRDKITPDDIGFMEYLIEKQWKEINEEKFQVDKSNKLKEALSNPFRAIKGWFLKDPSPISE